MLCRVDHFLISNMQFPKMSMPFIKSFPTVLHATRLSWVSRRQLLLVPLLLHADCESVIKISISQAPEHLTCGKFEFNRRKIKRVHLCMTASFAGWLWMLLGARCHRILVRVGILTFVLREHSGTLWHLLAALNHNKPPWMTVFCRGWRLGMCVLTYHVGNINTDRILLTCTHHGRKMFQRR